MCNPCLSAERADARSSEKESALLDKQQRHHQKIIDQTAKADGTFHGPDAKRRCLICQQTKPRGEYSGKQWKQLYRECKICVNERQSSGVPKKRHPGEVEAELRQIVERLCSGCKGTKGRNDFSPKQWKNPLDLDRMCKVCWAEEEVAREEHRAAEEKEKCRRGNDPHSPMTKRCYACHIFKALEAFSSKQKKKSYGVCTPCVAVLQEERRRDANRAKTARLCFVCKVEKGLDGYAREQWKRADRRCRVCATEHVKARDEHRLAEKLVKEERNRVASIAVDSSNPPLTRRCFECKEFKQVDGFSGRQWMKTYATCRECSLSMRGERKKRSAIPDCTLKVEEDTSSKAGEE